MRLLNPFNEEFDAVSIKFKVFADFEFELLQDFQLTGNITDIVIEVTEFETYFKSRVNAATINRQIASLKETSINLANTWLSMDNGIPVPKQVEQELS